MNEPFSKEDLPKIRFNNIDDYFIDNDKQYIFFKDRKEVICYPYTPITIRKGERNSVLFYYLSQITALNKTINRSYLKKLAESINLKMKPKLSEREVNSVINSILKNKEEGTLEMFRNKERRFLFNPRMKLTHREKMKIVNSELGKKRKEITNESIYLIIEDWDFEADGKITQYKVAIKTEFSLSTVKRYWNNYKYFVKDLNQDFNMKK